MEQYFLMAAVFVLPGEVQGGIFFKRGRGVSVELDDALNSKYLTLLGHGIFVVLNLLESHTCPSIKILLLVMIEGTSVLPVLLSNIYYSTHCCCERADRF